VLIKKGVVLMMISTSGMIIVSIFFAITTSVVFYSLLHKFIEKPGKAFAWATTLIFFVMFGFAFYFGRLAVINQGSTFEHLSWALHTIGSSSPIVLGYIVLCQIADRINGRAKGESK